MDTIHERLQQTPEQYEMMVWSIWAHWCKEISKNKRNTAQKLMICQPLINWWYRELQKLEAQFLEETIFNPDAKYARQLYAEFTVEIFNRFSKPILTKALKK